MKYQICETSVELLIDAREAFVIIKVDGKKTHKWSTKEYGWTALTFGLKEFTHIVDDLHHNRSRSELIDFIQR
jgi:hypothetical protein